MSGSLPAAPLGELLFPIETWTPERQAPDQSFTYIDLSSIDALTKQIVEPRTILGSEAPSRARQRIAAGDVLVSTVRPNLNGVARVSRQLDGSTASTGFCVLRPRVDQLDSAYLFHWVKSPQFIAQMVSRATGASYPAVSDRIVGESRIPLPHVTEQRRISEILDKADALRANRRAALAQLDTLTQAIFLDMFGDPATNPGGWPLRSVGEFIQSASYGTSEKAGPIGDFSVLRMNNITRTGEIDLVDLKYMNLRQDERERYLVRTGDVLFNRTNSADLVGKTAIYRHSRPMAYAGYLIRLRVASGNDPEYLAAFLNTAYSKRVLRGMCRSIIGMANINATELRKVKIPEPPSSLQNEFASRVVFVEKLRAVHRAASAELDALFASLQHRAFRGEL